MSPPRERDPRSTRQIVGAAVQDLAARRLARGFLPLGVLFLVGGAALVRSWSAAPMVLTLGAIASAVAMTWFAQATVGRAFGRDASPWMRAAPVAAVLPPVYALWAFVMEGLRPLVERVATLGLYDRVEAVVIALAAGRLFYLAIKLPELHTLAASRTVPAPEELGDAP